MAVTSGVRLSRVQYAQEKPGIELTEISMDAGISGDYPAIMRFINSLERDRTFFIIRGMSLTGQQGGLVNLRLRVSTWLRPADAEASGLPMAPSAGDESPAAPRSGKEWRINHGSALSAPENKRQGHSGQRVLGIVLCWFAACGFSTTSSLGSPSTADLLVLRLVGAHATEPASRVRDTTCPQLLLQATGEAQRLHERRYRSLVAFR